LKIQRSNDHLNLLTITNTKRRGLIPTNITTWRIRYAAKHQKKTGKDSLKDMPLTERSQRLNLIAVSQTF